MLLLGASLWNDAVAAEEPSLVVAEKRVTVGTVASFTFTPGGAVGGVDAAARVDGCMGVELERRAGETWVPVPPTALCDGSALARPVDGRLLFSVDPPGEGTYRGVVAWGVGCVSGRPFALSACSVLGASRSEPFDVVAAPRPADQR